jgi:hypothetical protein
MIEHFSVRREPEHLTGSTARVQNPFVKAPRVACPASSRNKEEEKSDE